MEFGEPPEKSKGWGFFMDMISKYRQREKISNTIIHFNEAKRKWKEEEIEKMSQKVHTLANHAHHHNKKGTGHHITHHT